MTSRPERPRAAWVRPPGGRRVDLHTHTSYSDGLLTPTALVRRAIDIGLAALGITDHDSIDGLPEARIAAGSRLEIVPGIEISSARASLELHVLGYYVDPENATLRTRLLSFGEERRGRLRAMADRLSAAGAPVDPDEVIALAGEGVVGRPHLADALVRAGHASSVDDAFRRYLSNGAVAYVPRPMFDAAEAIELIHQAGGVSVLAHPGPHLADSLIEELAARGLRGLEVWHPQHTGVHVRRYQGLASRLGLLCTGGSDFHGPGRGAELGDRPVPMRVLEALKRAAGVAG